MSPLAIEAGYITVMTIHLFAHLIEPKMTPVCIVKQIVVFQAYLPFIHLHVRIHSTSVNHHYIHILLLHTLTPCL